jgi:hypothetical protein
VSESVDIGILHQQLLAKWKKRDDDAPRRDLFAASALAGSMARPASADQPSVMTADGFAIEAVSFADALIAELRRTEAPAINDGRIECCQCKCKPSSIFLGTDERWRCQRCHNAPSSKDAPAPSASTEAVATGGAREELGPCNVCGSALHSTNHHQCIEEPD